MKKIPFTTTPVGHDIAVNADNEEIETHIPCRVHVIKNRDAEGFINLNLLSSPSLQILKNKKEPKRNAHIMIRNEIIRLPILKPIDILEEKNVYKITVK